MIETPSSAKTRTVSYLSQDHIPILSHCGSVFNGKGGVRPEMRGQSVCEYNQRQNFTEVISCPCFSNLWNSVPSA